MRRVGLPTKAGQRTDVSQCHRVSLAEHDPEARYWLARFKDDPAVVDVSERALAAPPWDGPPTWHHGDLDMRNWLIREGRISGVIDWGEMGVGEPACDVQSAWKLHSPKPGTPSGRPYP